MLHMAHCINDQIQLSKIRRHSDNGLPKTKNVLGKTKRECEEKLAVMIEEMKREVDQQKEKLQEQSQSEMVIQ